MWCLHTCLFCVWSIRAAWQKSHHDVKHECWLFIVETEFCVLLVHLWTYCDHRQDINSIRICTDLESRGKCLNLEMKTFGSRNALIPENLGKVMKNRMYHPCILPRANIVCGNSSKIHYLYRGKPCISVLSWPWKDRENSIVITVQTLLESI